MNRHNGKQDNISRAGMTGLQKMQHYAPDRINQQKNDTYSIWYAMTPREWVSKAPWCSDVLLKQVAAND